MNGTMKGVIDTGLATVAIADSTLCVDCIDSGDDWEVPLDEPTPEAADQALLAQGWATTPDGWKAERSPKTGNVESYWADVGELVPDHLRDFPRSRPYG